MLLKKKMKRKLDARYSESEARVKQIRLTGGSPDRCQEIHTFYFIQEEDVVYGKERVLLK